MLCCFNYSTIMWKITYRFDTRTFFLIHVIDLHLNLVLGVCTNGKTNILMIWSAFNNTDCF